MCVRGGALGSPERGQSKGRRGIFKKAIAYVGISVESALPIACCGKAHWPPVLGGGGRAGSSVFRRNPVPSLSGNVGSGRGVLSSR